MRIGFNDYTFCFIVRVLDNCLEGLSGYEKGMLIKSVLEYYSAGEHKRTGEYDKEKVYKFYSKED